MEELHFTPPKLKSEPSEPTTIEIRAPPSYTHLDAVDPDLIEAEKPLKAKVYLHDPHAVNQHLLFSNPDLEEVDIDVIRQNESKLMEEEYKPKAWSVGKLNPIKNKGSLNENVVAMPDTLNIKDNMICIDIQTPENKTTNLQVSFFKGGIIRAFCVNPVNPSKFCFELIEKPANLTPCPIADLASKDGQQVQVTLLEDQIKVQLKFNPLNIVILSTRTKTEETIFEINANKCLKFDKNVTGDFRFHTPYVYGLPEHAENLLLSNTKTSLPYRLYNNDLFGYQTNSRQALYGSIPMIVSRKTDSPTFVSLYWQNTSETLIDVHKTEKTADTFWISERGNFDCYVFVNFSARNHFDSIANYSGRASMPQYFSLGYHQCRYSYNDEQDLLHVNEKFNEHEIPCDSLTLDIDHTNGFRYFTWDREMFPDPLFMQDIIAKDGRKLITIADPHIKVSDDYPVYLGAIEREVAVKTSDGMPFVGVCFPGDCIWIDFLNEEGREFWSSRYSFENYKLSTPILFAWNDMNEPSVFEHKDKAMPRDNLHTIKSLAEPDKAFQVEHREVHNIYGYCMHKGTYNGLLRRNKDQNIRPHVLSRAFYIGSQKWTTIWTGDTISSWEHLQATVPMMLSMAICGISFIGGDVGGFLGNPEPELNVRWTQLGSYMPYFRAHCDKRYDRREPWLNTKEYYDIIKDTIKEKYKFLSYWYTCFEDYCRTGIPVIRPIWFDENATLSPAVMGEQIRFFVGDGLLVVPILEAGKTSVKDPLKGLGGRWYEYYYKTEVKSGADVETGLERIGVFVKGGHIIPQFEVKNHMKSSKQVKEGNIFLFVGLDENETAQGTMYFDDGETFDFRKGVCTHKKFSFKGDTLTWEDAGKSGYNPGNQVARIKLMGHTKKFTNAYLVREGGMKQEVEVEYAHGFIRANLLAPANENWKLVFQLEI